MAIRPIPGEVERWERERFERAPERDAPFSTISGEPIKPLYTEAICPRTSRRRSGCRASFRSRAGCTRRCIAAAVDDAPVRRVRYGGGDQRAVPLPARSWADRALDRVRHALADGPRLRLTRARSGRSAARGWRSTRSQDMETLFAGIPLDEVSVSMTINAPAAIMLAFYVVAAERQGIAGEPARRDDPDRHPQGVHRAEGVVLPGRSGDAAGERHDRVVL